MKKISAGTIIKLNNSILLGHSTNNAHWDIPKGMIEHNESPIDTAIRETFEETNIQLNKEQLMDL